MILVDHPWTFILSSAAVISGTAVLLIMLHYTYLLGRVRQNTNYGYQHSCRYQSDSQGFRFHVTDFRFLHRIRSCVSTKMDLCCERNKMKKHSRNNKIGRFLKVQLNYAPFNLVFDARLWALGETFNKIKTFFEYLQTYLNTSSRHDSVAVDSLIT